MSTRLRTLLWTPWVVVVASSGLALRAWVLLSSQGSMDADEAVTGLGAVDALNGRFRVVVPANAYTSMIESYLLAPFVAVFGSRVTLVKMLPITIWALASVAAVGAGRRLRGDRAGLVAGAATWLVPGLFLVLTTRAYLGYTGGAAVCFAFFWAALRTLDLGPDRRRSAVVGGLAGIALFMHPIYASILLPAAAVLSWQYRRRVAEWFLPAGIGVVVALMPFAVWNLRNGFASFEEQNGLPGTYFGRLGGFFTGLLPRDLGQVDNSGRWLLGRPLGVAAVAVVLLAVALAGAQLLRSDAKGALVGVPLFLCWPLLALSSPLVYTLDGRYGIVPFPMMVLAFGSLVGPAAWTARIRRRSLAGLVAVWAVVYIAPYQIRFLGSRFGDPNASTAALIARLDGAGITQLKGSYWVVLPVTYTTNGRIASAVVEGFPVRYPHYQVLVDSAPPEEVAFAFRTVEAPDQADLTLPIEQYERVDLPGIVLFLPPTAAAGAGS